MNNENKHTKPDCPLIGGRWKHIPSCRDIGENLKAKRLIRGSVRNDE